MQNKLKSAAGSIQGEIVQEKKSASALTRRETVGKTRDNVEYEIEREKERLNERECPE